MKENSTQKKEPSTQRNDKDTQKHHLNEKFRAKKNYWIEEKTLVKLGLSAPFWAEGIVYCTCDDLFDTHREHETIDQREIRHIIHPVFCYLKRIAPWCSQWEKTMRSASISKERMV